MKIKAILHAVTDASQPGGISHFTWTNTETGATVQGVIGGGENNVRILIHRVFGGWTREVYFHSTELKSRKFEAWKGDANYMSQEEAEAACRKVQNV